MACLKRKLYSKARILEMLILNWSQSHGHSNNRHFFIFYVQPSSPVPLMNHLLSCIHHALPPLVWTVPLK